jgi:hypothetical protein
MDISTEVQEEVRAQMLNLALLRSPDAKTRERVCSGLSNFFEYWVSTSRGDRSRHFRDEIREAMEALIDVAIHDTNAKVIEGSLYALSQAVFFAGASGLVNWDPLVAKLGQLDLVDYVLPMLADTENSKYRSIIGQFVDDPRDRVRASAREGLADLDLELNIAAGHRAFEAAMGEAQALEQGMASVPLFQASNFLFGFYVRPHEMANRNGPSWQNYRAALQRLDLPDFFDEAGTQARLIHRPAGTG